MLGGVVADFLFLPEEAEEVAHGHQGAGHRAAVQPLLVQLTQKIHHVLATEAPEGQVPRLAEAGEFFQVAPVGGQRVGGETPLHANVVQVGCDVVPHYFWLGV